MKGGSHNLIHNPNHSNMVRAGAVMHKGGRRRKSAKKSGKRTSRRRNKTAKQTTLFKFW